MGINIQIPEESIRQLIREEVNLQLNGLADGILSHLHKPEYENWGRYLNYDQTAKYLSVGKSGLRKRLAAKGIHPIEFNAREKVFDRYELDRLKVNEFLDNYKNRIRK